MMPSGKVTWKHPRFFRKKDRPSAILIVVGERVYYLNEGRKGTPIEPDRKVYGAGYIIYSGYSIGMLIVYDEGAGETSTWDDIPLIEESASLFVLETGLTLPARKLKDACRVRRR